MLEWSQCTIGYRENVPILDQFSLTCDDSAIIVGPSGVGKSTLLATMMGLVPYVKGHLRVGQREVNGLPQISRQYLSYLPAANLLPLDVTVEEYLTELARIDGLSWSSARRQALAMAARLHLAEVLTRRIRWLSGGMKRRTLLAAAVLKPAEWLMVDQATAGLDPEEQRTVLDLLQAETQSRGVLMVTQELDELAQFQKRVLILMDGNIIFDGSSEDLRDTARGHVFQRALDSTPPPFDFWQPLPNHTAIKVYQHSIPKGCQAIAPEVEDGYFWQIMTTKGRDHDD
ncbi:MAG: ABC transporter ATP-binding protein [Firmicutes bacterium]|nr:ABC transporter ATP-binding protein [Bacillota bacterium]MCL5063883.1 ABC transporter ATP-binding protein [Bacillota bacterium]